MAANDTRHPGLARTSLRAIVEAALDCIIGMDEGGAILEFNPAAERTFGYSRSEVIGRQVAELMIPPALRDAHHRGLAHYLATGEGPILDRRIEVTAVRRDGTEFPAELTVTAIADSGAPSFFAYLRDLTEHKRHEETQERLSQQREQFVTLADSIPQLAWMARPDGSIFWYNKRWYEYTGTTPEQMVGWGWQSVHDPGELPRVMANFKAAIAAGELWEDTFPLRRHDGVMRWHLSRALPVRDDSGRIVRWFGTNTDITERLRMEEDLRRAREELEQRVRERTAALEAANDALRREIRERTEAQEKADAVAVELQRSNRELEEFASVASHDLQEPLRKIQAFGDRLQARCAEGLGEAGRDYLERIRSAAVRMSTLINDLLVFARVTTRAQPFAAVDLAGEVRRVVSDLEGRLQQTGGRVEIGDLPTVYADPTQMRQLFQNLIANGLKFFRPGEPPVVRVEARPSTAADGGEWWEITVEDNGIGFDEKYLDRIFEVFQRLHGRGEYEGTGIGLAICRKIVERHGGTITARSSPGQGATFVVTVPARTPGEEKTT